MKLGSPIYSSYILKKLYGLASFDLLDAPLERITLGFYTKSAAVRLSVALMTYMNYNCIYSTYSSVYTCMVIQANSSA